MSEINSRDILLMAKSCEERKTVEVSEHFYSAEEASGEWPFMSALGKSDKEDFELVASHEFYIDESLINAHEKAAGFEFEMLPMKREIDKWSAEVSNSDEWSVLSEKGQAKTYIRYRGLDCSPDLPILMDIYRFREVDDIKLVAAGLLDFRHVWDNDKK